MPKREAVVLLSGGLDSAVTLYLAGARGYRCHCLVFEYGQRHRREILQARRLAVAAGADLTNVSLSFPWKGSSLIDRRIALPSGRGEREIRRGGIPTTYVPARNTVFLSIAASFAEATGSSAVFIGAHSGDSSGYPDCRKGYLDAMRSAIRKGTRAGLAGMLRLEYPLINKSKSEIIRLGKRLGVPFELTWSCYEGGDGPCMKCDSCILRQKGFREAGIEDPVIAGERRKAGVRYAEQTIGKTKSRD